MVLHEKKQTKWYMCSQSVHLRTSTRCIQEGTWRIILTVLSDGGCCYFKVLSITGGKKLLYLFSRDEDPISNDVLWSAFVFSNVCVICLLMS